MQSHQHFLSSKPSPKTLFRFFIVFLSGTALTLSLFISVKDWERETAQFRFNTAADNRINRLQNAIENSLMNLASLQSFYAASEYVSRNEFDIFVTHLLKKHTDIQAFEWIPKISNTKRNTFEALGRRETGPEFKIYEYGKNPPKKAAERKESYPVYYAVPVEANRKILGYDYASDPEKNKAMQRAADIHRMAATRASKLRRLSETPYGFTVFEPIFRKGKSPTTPELRKQALSGYVAAVFHIEMMLNKIFTNSPLTEMTLEVYGETETGTREILYRYGEPSSRSNSFEFQEFVNIADQKWLISARSTRLFESSPRWASKLVLISGFLLTLIILLIMINLGQIRRQEILKILSLHDDLTGLYNRRGFLTIVEEHLKIAKRKKQDYLMLFADLDGLKKINDTHGHKEGDTAILNAAKMLKKTFRRSDIIARIGGDEFAIFAVEAPREKAPVLIAHLEENLKAYNAKHWHPYALSLSVGGVYLPLEESLTVDALLGEADKSMYEMKKSHKKTSS